MTLDAESATGQAVLVPLKNSIHNIADLILEAQALWRAEARGETRGSISASWGTVGAQFHGAPSGEPLI